MVASVTCKQVIDLLQRQLLCNVHVRYYVVVDPSVCRQ